jgi:hypothetical protein
MKRRVWLSAACVVFGASVAVETLACGDKLLVVGRGARYQRGYVAVYPTSVLVVDSAPGNELLAPLKRAGHRVEVVRDSGELRRAIASNNYEVVLADWSRAPEVQALVSAASTAMFVPVLSGASASDLEAAKKTYGCPLESSKPKLNKNFLARLDDVIDAKRRSKPLSCNVQ